MIWLDILYSWFESTLHYLNTLYHDPHSIPLCVKFPETLISEAFEILNGSRHNSLRPLSLKPLISWMVQDMLQIPALWLTDWRTDWLPDMVTPWDAYASKNVHCTKCSLCSCRYQSRVKQLSSCRLYTFKQKRSLDDTFSISTMTLEPKTSHKSFLHIWNLEE